MERLDTTAARALRAALEGQPLTAAKVNFAWTLAAGPALARATTISWSDGVLSIRAKSANWHREVNRARAVILQRLTHLLGPDVVKDLRVLEGDTRRV